MPFETIKSLDKIRQNNEELRRLESGLDEPDESADDKFEQLDAAEPGGEQVIPEISKQPVKIEFIDLKEFEKKEYEEEKINCDPLGRFIRDNKDRLGLNDDETGISYYLIIKTIIDRDTNKKSGGLAEPEPSNYHDFLKIRSEMDPNLKKECDVGWDITDGFGNKTHFDSPDITANNKFWDALHDPGNKDLSDEWEKLKKQVLSEIYPDEYAEKVKNGEIKEKAPKAVPELEPEAEKLVEALPEKEKIKLGKGILNLGLFVEENKCKFFSKLYKGAARPFVKKDKHIAEQGMMARFLHSMAENYENDAIKAKKTKERTGVKLLLNTRYLASNISMYGRLAADVAGWTAASPFRFYMAGAMFFAKGFKATKEARLKSEEVINKTRLEQQEAWEEAIKLYEGKWNEKTGALKGEVTAEDIEKAYIKNLPKDLLARLHRKVDASEANGIIQRIVTGDVRRSVKKINEKIEDLESRQAAWRHDKRGAIWVHNRLTPEECEAKKQKLLRRYEKHLQDLDRIVSQAGTADALAMGAKYLEAGAKGAMAGLTAESLYLLTENISKIYNSFRAVLTDEQASISEKLTSLAGKFSGSNKDNATRLTEQSAAPKASNEVAEKIDNINQKFDQSISQRLGTERQTFRGQSDPGIQAAKVQAETAKLEFEKATSEPINSGAPLDETTAKLEFEKNTSSPVDAGTLIDKQTTKLEFEKATAQPIETKAAKIAVEPAQTGQDGVNLETSEKEKPLESVNLDELDEAKQTAAASDSSNRAAADQITTEAARTNIDAEQSRQAETQEKEVTPEQLEQQDQINVLTRQGAGKSIKAVEQPAEPKTPLNKGGEEVELKDVEIGLVKKGKGIEQSLYKQIKANFKEYGFNGDETNRAQINKFAQQQAHVLAEKMGYVDSAQGKEIRVRSADKVAYILGKDKDGELTVKEYSEVNGKFKLAGTRYFSDGFKGGGENEYEYVHSNRQIGKAEQVKAEAAPIANEAKYPAKAEIFEDNTSDKSALLEEKQKLIHGDLLDRDSWRKELSKDENGGKQIISGWVRDSLDFSNNSKLIGKDVSIVARDLDHNGVVDAIYITDNTDKDKSYSIAEFHGQQAVEKFGADLKSAGIEAEKYAHKLIDARLEEFEKIADNKIPVERAEELGIKVFKQNGLSPADTAKLEFIKDKGFNSDISYEKIKALFKIYDELKGTEIDLKQIDKYFNAVKDIDEPAISAKLIKVWDEPSELNFQNLLEQLKPLDPKAGFEKLTAGKRPNGDLVINYITKGHNGGNYMMVFRPDGKAILERPGGIVDKFDHISDLKKVLSEPGKMVMGAEEGGEEADMDYELKYETSGGNGEEELPPNTYVTTKGKK